MKTFRTIYYVEVGTLPPKKAEAYLREMAEKYKVNQLPHEQSLFIPTRIEGAARVDIQLLPVDERRYIDTQAYDMPREVIEQALNRAAQEYAIRNFNAENSE